MRQTGGPDEANWLFNRLREEISSLSLEEAIPMIRHCSHYLNLSGIAETHHRVRTGRRHERQSKSFAEVFSQLINQGVSMDDLFEHVSEQRVEVVLTAHPTQVNRRTLQYKHTRIEQCLERNDRPDLTAEERELNLQDLVREVCACAQRGGSSLVFGKRGQRLTGVPKYRTRALAFVHCALSR